MPVLFVIYQKINKNEFLQDLSISRIPNRLHQPPILDNDGLVPNSIIQFKYIFYRQTSGPGLKAGCANLDEPWSVRRRRSAQRLFPSLSSISFEAVILLQLYLERR